MARLLTTGAESGALATEGLTADGMAVSSAAERTGAFGFRGDPSLFQYASFAFTGVTQRNYYARTYFRKSANPTGQSYILGLDSTTPATFAYVAIETNGTLTLHQGDGTQIGSASAALSDNTFYRVELRARVGTSTANGQVELLLDGVQVATSSAADLGTVAPGSLNIFAYAVSSSASASFDHDDIAFNDDQGASDNTFPGAGSIPAVPVVEGTAESATTTAGTSHVITLPASIAATDLVLVTMDIGSTSATVNALAGWTEILDEAVANGLKIFQYTGAGVPSNPTFVTSASTRSASIAWRISGADEATTPVIGTTATGTSVSPDPPAVTPAGGVNSYRFIAFAGMAGEEADDDTWGNTPPTNYTPSPPLQKACGTAGTNLGGLILAASRGATVATENPGTFNVDVSAAWRAQTIAVYPAVPTTPVDGPVLDLLWDLRAAVDGPVLDLPWDLIAEVNAPVLDLPWDLYAEVNGPVLDLVWDLASVDAVNGPPLQLVWDTNAAVDGPALDLTWDLRTPVDGPVLDLPWDLTAAVDGGVLDLTWDLYAAVDGSALGLVWDLGGGTPVDGPVLRLLWDLAAAVDAPPLYLPWDITESILVTNPNVSAGQTVYIWRFDEASWSAGGLHDRAPLPDAEAVLQGEGSTLEAEIDVEGAGPFVVATVVSMTLDRKLVRETIVLDEGVSIPGATVLQGDDVEWYIRRRARFLVARRFAQSRIAHRAR